MKRTLAFVLGVTLAAALVVWTVDGVQANGGPFVVKYPAGDPAAKGVLARLSPNLKPERETRLRVVKEDLTIVFDASPGFREPNLTPLARVTAAYTIENPTAEELVVDFGFPILRGIYMNPLAMMPRPDVAVHLDGAPAAVTVISNSAIYGLIRRQARALIDQAVRNDAQLAERAAAARVNEAGKRALIAYLTDVKKWNARDAALMSEYVGLNFDGKLVVAPRDGGQSWFFIGDSEMRTITFANLGPLAAIGEQKATQFFAQLASKFDPQAAASYEAIFTAWGGDVRERSVDMKTGEIRPRELIVDAKGLEKSDLARVEPTVYARVDYFDENVNIGEAEKAACKNILKNLPVVFTFAPMNLLHYQVKFPAKTTKVLSVTYAQYAFADTRAPRSYQLAYVVHPASLWRDFGPIHLEVRVPTGIPFKSSVKCEKAAAVENNVRLGQPTPFDVYRAELREKTGELFLAVDGEAWKNRLNASKIGEKK